LAQKIRRGDRASRTLHPAQGPADDHQHVAQFYDSSDFLADSVGAFLAEGLLDGDAAVAIATKIDLRSLDRALIDAGADPASARADDRYVTLDAAETLDEFMVDGSPDARLFEASLAPLIDRLRRPGSDVRIFGEMVALLWAEGNVTGAIRLEELWNELGESHAFSLLCGYPMSAFNRQADAARFEEVCEKHSRVIPAESYSGIPDPDERLRNVARLQQKAGSGIYEHKALRLKHTQLEDALTKLKELDRMRNEFVAMVVHDIRAPTAVIGGFLELLRDNWSTLDEDRIKDLLDRGLKNARHISSFVNDLLTVAQLESSEFPFEIQPLDLAEIVHRCVSGVRDAAPHHHFHVSIAPELPLALGDEARQIQILNNLLTNAVKFSPQDSTIRVAAEPDGDHLVVSVEDEGVGIAAEDLSKLFLRFSRLKQPGGAIGGSGLGLFISKVLVEGQGGTIRVESQIGHGSKFSYTIPVDAGRYS
jgi:signal transduction histidine kinase